MAIGRPKTQPSTCTVDGCNADSYGRGYCLSHYRRWKRHGDPLGGKHYGPRTEKKCSLCGIVKPLEAYSTRQGRCKPCLSQYRSNLPSALAYRRKRTLKSYGMTEHDYEERLARQGGRCATCQRVPQDKVLDVDHDHATGAVRGLLCSHCNTALSRVNDSPEILQNLIDYLLTSAENQSIMTT